MATRPRLLSEVRFASFLVYSPRGRSAVSRQSRDITYDIKQDRGGIIGRAIEVLKENFEKTKFAEFLGPEVVLVPTPKSAPLFSKESLWPAMRICEELIAQELGQEILPCLSRAEAVPKSAWSAPGNRPTAQMHLESLAIEPRIEKPARITLVDDVVTKGNTLLAAASLVQWVFPDAEVRAFALVRTLGLVLEIERIIDPCVGTILRVGNEANREP